jgi:hypothetical protein
MLLHGRPRVDQRSSAVYPYSTLRVRKRRWSEGASDEYRELRRDQNKENFDW